MIITDAITFLEFEWSEGFLYSIRQGIFVVEQGKDFVLKLNKIALENSETLNRRFVSLLWYIPQFLEWQKERLESSGINMDEYRQVSNSVLNTVEEILGVP